MSTGNNIPDMVLVVSLTNLEDNPELLSILKCYFENIPDISKLGTLEICTYVHIVTNYVYIHNSKLAKVLYKFTDTFYDYIKVFTLFTNTLKESDAVVYDTLFNSNKILINKKALNQYIKDI